MTVRVSWLYPSPAGPAGGQSREDTRLSPIGTMWPTGPTTSRSGVIPGGSPLALSGSGMTATIGLGRAVVQGTTAQGAYAAAVTAPHAVVLGNGHASLPRIDVIALRVYDTVYDATGQSIGDIVVVQGAANASPTAPAMPSPTTMPLYQITVPAGASAGTGGLTWGTATDLRVYTVAAGGILPVDASSAAGSYVGQVRIVSGRLVQWDGAAWAEFTLPSTISPSTWGAWTQSTPTWQADGSACTIGNGTLYQRWCRVGRLIQVRIRLRFGSTTNAGAVNSQWTWSIPVAASTTPDNAEYAAGSAGAIRTGAAYYGGTVLLNPGTSRVSVIEGGSGFNWGPTLNTPFPTSTPGTTDTLWLAYAYEAAS